MAALADRVKVATATAGTGPVTLGAAVAGFQTFAAGGVDDGQAVPYLIENGANAEIGIGVYTAAGATMSRSMSFSTTGALLNLSGAATVSIVPTAAMVSRASKATIYTASGTWAKEDGLKACAVVCIGAGGGGGSGRRGAAATARSGGSGGGGGGYSTGIFDAANLGDQVTVTIGAQGFGAAVRGTDNVNGSGGTTGGTASFGSHIRATGGNAGGGGVQASLTAPGAGSGVFPGGAGGVTSVTGTPSSAVNLSGLGGTGGGGGGSISTADVELAPGAGGTLFGCRSLTGGTANNNGNSVAVGMPMSGTGGGGGSSSITGHALPGGNGGNYGGGGGGGGASLNGVGNSGAGGHGGPGIVVVVDFF